MGRGAWQAAVYGVAKIWTWLNVWAQMLEMNVEFVTLNLFRRSCAFLFSLYFITINSIMAEVLPDNIIINIAT